MTYYCYTEKESLPSKKAVGAFPAGRKRFRRSACSLARRSRQAWSISSFERGFFLLFSKNCLYAAVSFSFVSQWFELFLKEIRKSQTRPKIPSDHYSCGGMSRPVRLLRPIDRIGRAVGGATVIPSASRTTNI